MKAVCFGDSNTWGYNGADRSRQESRWTRLLQKAHPDWEIVEEGLSGRTLSNDDPFSLPRNGARQIDACIRTHTPFDVLVVLLGTNDCKHIYGSSAGSLERALQNFMNQATNPAMFRRSPYEAPRILLVQPPRFDREAMGGNGEFEAADMDILEQILPAWQRTAQAYGCEVLETPQLIGGKADGVHLDEKGHQQLALLVQKKLEEMEKEPSRT